MVDQQRARQVRARIRRDAGRPIAQDLGHANRPAMGSARCPACPVFSGPHSTRGTSADARGAPRCAGDPQEVRACTSRPAPGPGGRDGAVVLRGSRGGMAILFRQPVREPRDRRRRGPRPTHEPWQSTDSSDTPSAGRPGWRIASQFRVFQVPVVLDDANRRRSNLAARREACRRLRHVECPPRRHDQRSTLARGQHLGVSGETRRRRRQPVRRCALAIHNTTDARGSREQWH